ncbi:pentatricopeptide repeat (PPR) superfamily protein [Tasmannia lanceolata]|uniref:pentatricopeptide repeat (PPR) superfamily protein n=1 Tax=Tasmannia lanceolata TaxID=3420 RepID=UPI0040641582
MMKLKYSTRFIPPLIPPFSPFQLQNSLFHDSSLLPLPSPDLQNLCNVISGVGNLDDLESNLNKSTVQITPTLITQTLNSCKTLAPTHRLLRFFSWSQKNLHESTKISDDTFNNVIQILAQRKDLTAIEILISDLRKEKRKMYTETFCCIAETLVGLGREDDAIGIFKNLEKLLNCPKDGIALSAIVHWLCSKGHARKAQGVVWHHRDNLSISVETHIYRSILHGWCVDGNVKEARMTLDKMKSLSIHLGLFSFNAFLRCVCERNLKCNPSALVSGAENVMMEMTCCSVLPNAVSFNILLSCLGRTRRVKEACRVLDSMRGMGCSPDWMSYYLVARVLFLTGRFGRGNSIVNRMIEEGLDTKARFYHCLIGVLCGVEKMGYALQMFDQMKKREYSLGDYGPVYDLLIAKLCRGGEFDKGRELWDEAVERGIILQCSIDLLDPSKTEVFKPAKEEEMVRLKDSRSEEKLQKKCTFKMEKRKRKKTKAFAA